MHILAILMTLVIQTLSLRMNLRCLHDSLSRSGVDELLQLSNVILNSFLEKGAYIDVCLIFNFIQDVSVNLVMEHCVEGGVESIPQAI